MKTVTLLLVLLLFAFPATAQTEIPECTNPTSELDAALETLDTYQERLNELQTRLDRFVELQNQPAALRLMEWAVFADYHQQRTADTIPACGDYLRSQTAYLGIIEHTYAVSAQLQVNFNTSMISIQSMMEELLPLTIAALTEDIQTWIDIYPTLAP